MNASRIVILWLTLVLSFGLTACGGGGGGGGVADSDGDGVPNADDAFPNNAARFAAFTPLVDASAGTAFSVAVAAGNTGTAVVAVGQSDLGGTTLRGQRWSLDTQLIDPVLNAETLAPLPAQSYSAAYGVTPAGLAVGESALGANTVPVFWAAGSTAATALSLSDGTTSYSAGAAYGVNDSGQIVGEVIRADGSRMAVLWQPTAGVYGNALPLPELAAGLSATAHAISANGWIAGEAQTAAGLRGALWQVNAAGAIQGSTIQLAPIDASHVASSAFGVDVLGQVVGESVAANGVVRGVRWVLSGTTVAGIVQLGANSSAMAISAENDRIVGAATTASELRAAIWDIRSVNPVTFDAVLSSGPDLFTPTAGSSRAFGMSSSGVVAGLALDKAFVAFP